MTARFFRSDAMSEKHGETDDVLVEREWFQITYDALRGAPDGDIVAEFDSATDAWFVTDSREPYSDVVLFTEGTA